MSVEYASWKQGLEFAVVKAIGMAFVARVPIACTVWKHEDIAVLREMFERFGGPSVVHNITLADLAPAVIVFAETSSIALIVSASPSQ